jgi:hypothetical protein
MARHAVHGVTRACLAVVNDSSGGCAGAKYLDNARRLHVDRWTPVVQLLVLAERFARVATRRTLGEDPWEIEYGARALFPVGWGDCIACPQISAARAGAVFANRDGRQRHGESLACELHAISHPAPTFAFPSSTSPRELQDAMFHTTIV